MSQKQTNPENFNYKLLEVTFFTLECWTSSHINENEFYEILFKIKAKQISFDNKVMINIRWVFSQDSFTKF